MSREITANLLRLKSWTPSIQSAVAFHRKPRWLPVAKKRMFYIPPKPQISQEEKIELKRLNDIYHTQMRAIRFYYHEQMLKEKQSQLDTTSEQYLQQENLDFERCMKINNEWNAERASDRELRRAADLKWIEERAIKIMNQKDRLKKQLIIKANEAIKREKEASKSFISADNLDDAIQHALANPVDYNYAIDLDGNKYVGREKNSSFEKKEEAIN